jgi:hypothetical protein
MFKGKTLVFGGESEMAVLQDYTIHTHRLGRKSVFDMHMEKTAPSPGTEVHDLLMAHQNAVFSAFYINGTEKGFYCHTTDVLREKDFTIIDHGLGRTVSSGSLLATRLISIPGSEFFMTTGTAIPFLRKESVLKLRHILSKLMASMPGGKPSPSQERVFAKQVIRMLLRMGTLDKVEYTDIPEA